MRFLRLLAAACLAVVTACSGGGASSQSSFAPAPPLGAAPGIPGTSPAGPNLVPPSGSIYLGAFVNAGGGGSDAARIAAFETQVGRTMALSLHYYGWTSNWPGADENADARAGRIPVISWNCGVPNAAVASGTQDANVAARAAAVKAYGRPIFVRYQWEFNLPADDPRQPCYDPATDAADRTFSPTEFVAAWQHIRSIFARVGATNAVWLWNPSGAVPNAALYYPGADQVDWVGIDQYDRSDESFAATYWGYPALAAFGKPMLITETGALPENQVSFLQAAAPTLMTQMPAVKGFIYFDASGHVDWRLTPAGIAAFAAMARNPYLGAR